MGQTGADVLSLEPKASGKLAREKCGPDIILMGGVDTAETLYLKDARYRHPGVRKNDRRRNSDSGPRLFRGTRNAAGKSVGLDRGCPGALGS